MTRAKSPEVLTKIDELEELARGGGHPDPEALRRVRELVFALRFGATGYGREKLAGLMDWFEILYSSRKFERHGSVQNVRTFILGDCMALRSGLAWVKDGAS